MKRATRRRSTIFLLSKEQQQLELLTRVSSFGLRNLETDLTRNGSEIQAEVQNWC